MRASTTEQPTSSPPDLRLLLAGTARAAAAGLVPEPGGRRDQARSRHSGPPPAPESHRLRRLRNVRCLRRLRRLAQASRALFRALSAWWGESYGIDPAYLGVLLLASFQLGVQRILDK